jgi:hypothetical protein
VRKFQLSGRVAQCVDLSLLAKRFAKRQMLTLVGLVEWKRRVGRCPHHCPGSQRIPLDEALKIQAYQQTSTELIRLGCLLAVFLPFNLASHGRRDLFLLLNARTVCATARVQGFKTPTKFSRGVAFI